MSKGSIKSPDIEVDELKAENVQLKSELSTAEEMIDELQKNIDLSPNKGLPLFTTKEGDYQFVAGKFKLWIEEEWKEFTAEEAVKNKTLLKHLIEIGSGVIKKQ